MSVTTEAKIECRKCHRLVTEDEMKRDSRYKSGFSSYCKVCHTAATKDWQRRNPERMRATRAAYDASDHGKAQHSRNRKERYRQDPEIYRWRNIRKLYRMDKATYESLLASQGGVCGICGAEPQRRPLVVDHDHSCCPGTPTCGNCTRGLLCSPCNFSLSHIVERGWFAQAQAYVEGR